MKVGNLRDFISINYTPVLTRGRHHGARLLHERQSLLQGMRDEQLRGGDREVLLLQLLPLQLRPGPRPRLASCDTPAPGLHLEAPREQVHGL